MRFTSFTIGVFAVVLGGAAASPVYADSPRAKSCTNATLSGDFAFTAKGTTLAALGLPAPLTGAFASSGTAEFDGNGHFTLTATSSFNGVIQGPQTVTGTYSVNADCSYTSQASNGATFRAVIVDSGREILILQTNKGVAITGTARVRGKEPGVENEDAPAAFHCSNASVAGSYGFLADGFAGAPTLPGTPFGPLVGVGVVTLNSDGTFKMMAQRSVAGVIDPEPLPLTGTYAMGPGCTFKMTFDVGFHFDATVVNRNETVFMETDPGTAVTVRAERI